jgi:carboxymethylenebutenolidase
MKALEIDIPAPGGTCDAYVARPDGAGPFPAVLLYMDAYGLRPYIAEMAERLAGMGYYVLAPNLFYRKSRSPVFDIQFPVKIEDRERSFGLIRPVIMSMTLANSEADAGCFLDFLAKQKEVKKGPVGITGYCMGGTLALRVAAWFPDRICAAACFHGGNLATDAPDSPHLGAPKMRCEVYVAHADNDQSAPPEQISRLHKALTDADVRFEAELYEGAMHGFTMRDLPPFNEQALERHWEKLSALLKGVAARAEG